jgi:hypothetical protein
MELTSLRFMLQQVGNTATLLVCDQRRKEQSIVVARRQFYMQFEVFVWRIVW